MVLANFFWFSTLSTVAFAAIYTSPERLSSLIFDFIIVGGGTAGSVLANRLTEIPYYQVLVIEAGPNNEGVLNSIVPGFAVNLAKRIFDWNFTTIPQAGLNGRSVEFQRGHGLGGSSSVNGMVYTRGSSSDYDRFARITGEPSWSWDALQPYVRKHEGFVPPVDWRNPAGELDSPSKEVILSAGSIGTPHILLHSGIGDENELAKVGIHPVLHLPGVGKNLTDHPLFVVGSVLNITDDAAPWGDLSTNATLEAEALQLWNKNKTGPLAVFRRFDQIVWARVPQSILPNGVDPSSGPNSAHYELALEGSATSIASGSSISIIFSGGSVSLATNNPFDAPLIDPAYYSAPVDLAIAKESIRAFFRFVAAPVWKDVLVGPRPPLVNNPSHAFLEDFLWNTSSSNAHALGTAAMSPVDASWGVVNPDLLLKKARGLRVVDASVYPFVPCAHTQASVYIIAERAADIVKAAWAA